MESKTIKIHEDNIKLLEKLREHPRETYDDLFNKFKKNKEKKK